jgi:hypothetical protein
MSGSLGWHHYRALGLALASRIEFPQFPPYRDREPDVVIDFGQVPEGLGPGRREGLKFQALDGRLLIRTERHADILVADGRKVLVQPRPGSSLDGIRMVLLGMGMGALLHQRGVLALHAGVVAGTRGAVALCARSGTGKTTLTAALVQRGFRILDDNLAPLDLAGPEPRVQPGSPELKLCADTLARCPAWWRERLPSWPCGRKTALVLRPWFEPEPQTLRAVVVLADGAAATRMERLRGARAFQALSEQVFCRRFVAPEGAAGRRLFAQTLALANSIPVFSLTLGLAKPSPETILEILKESLDFFC